MIKKVAYKKNKSSEKIHFKKENTLDYYINSVAYGVNQSHWWDKNDDAVESEANSKKYEFLKKNIKASSVLPTQIQKKRELPSKMGYFETDFGTIEVGYNKYKKGSSIGFSLVPEKLKSRNTVPKKKLNAPNVYFGGPIYGRSKKFKVSALSFKYDPHEKGEIKKLREDHDGIVDEEEKLLYQDKKEDEKIEKLKTVRHESDSHKKEIDKEIAKTRVIKEEKKEDNLAFLKEIDNFVDKVKKEKIKKYVDADDFISRRKRIIELSASPNLSEMDLNGLKRLLKKNLKKEKYEELLEKFLKIDIKGLTSHEIKELIINLTNKRSLGDNV